MSKLDLFVDGLLGARKSAGGWTAKCPAHEDEHASRVGRRHPLPGSSRFVRFWGFRVTDRLLTAEEIAKLLGVPARWVAAGAREGRIPCLRLGRYVRFDRGDVERWLESCKQGGRAATLRRRTGGV